MMLLLFIPIGITVHLAEKIGKILENEAPLNEVLLYFVDFTIYFAHLLFPLFLFLSVIWFTSKLANNTEIVAFLSSGVSFTRFLRPYLIGATIVAIISIVLGLYLAPQASNGFNDFDLKYLSTKKGQVNNRDVFRQVSDNDYIYVSSFNIQTKTGQNFTLEHFENDKLIYKIQSQNIKYIEKDTVYRLTLYVNDLLVNTKIFLLRKKEKTLCLASI